jgi:hypothetical protein
MNGKSPLVKNDGLKLAKKIHAEKYVECSSLTKEGLKDVFDEAILASLYPSEIYKKDESYCMIL